MRDRGLWHSELVRLVVSLRHTETLVLADAGLPVPPHVPTVELGWARGEPRLLPVLRAILGELVVEHATVAAEAQGGEFLAGLRRELGGVPLDVTSHATLKQRCGTARAVVRTGDDTPYSNVILRAGVPFGAATAPAEGGVADGHATRR